MKAILTSTGFDNKNIEKVFIKMLNRPVSEVKALFVPSALTLEAQDKYAQCFLDDLLGAGISRNNIDTYNLEYPFSERKIKNYDVIYFSGGDPKLLMDKIKLMDFDIPLKSFVENGGIYLGASAGSDIATNALECNLGYINIVIECHDKIGSNVGIIDTSSNITVKISDTQAVIIDGEKATVIE